MEEGCDVTRYGTGSSRSRDWIKDGWAGDEQIVSIWVPCIPTLMCKIKHLNPKLSYLYLNRFYRSVILIHVLCLHYFFGMQLPT
jgi:cbb3-type cytochrome oxidase subunit 1